MHVLFSLSLSVKLCSQDVRWCRHCAVPFSTSIPPTGRTDVIVPPASSGSTLGREIIAPPSSDLITNKMPYLDAAMTSEHNPVGWIFIIFFVATLIRFFVDLLFLNIAGSYDVTNCNNLHCFLANSYRKLVVILHSIRSHVLQSCLVACALNYLLLKKKCHVTAWLLWLFIST